MRKEELSFGVKFEILGAVVEIPMLKEIYFFK